jgi:tetratricopeptide (TPR) repeat protein
MLGTTLALRYEIISHLGGGGFGETFVARDSQLPGSPLCVVKQLKPLASDPMTLETARRLFDTEAQVLYTLGSHEQIPQLLAYFEEKQEFYLVQELIRGRDLSHELTPGKTLSQDQVVSLLQEILGILDFVHQQKVIHRDLNPGNILRREDDNKLVLIDFGAVKQITTQAITPQGTTRMTVAIGTPGYIPSEQAQGNPKFSSDIYALGIIGIQGLTGIPPEELEKDVDTDEIIWQHRCQVDPSFAAILDKMVRYDYRQRYPSVLAVKEAIASLTQLKSQSHSGTMVISPAASPSLSPTTPPHKKTPIQRKSRKGLLSTIIGVSVLLGISVAASIYIMNVVVKANATELYKQANTFLELQRYQDALVTYDKALEIKPDFAPAWLGQGKTFYNLRRYKEALTAYDKAIQLQADSLPSWTGRGLTLEKLERYGEAIASFDKALEFQNNSPELWSGKGNALLSLNRYDEAIKAFDKAIELKADDAQAWYSKGRALQSIKRYDDAISSYDKASQFKPDFVQAWYNRGNALVNLQRYNDAFAAYDKAVQYQPDFSLAWLSRGNTLINLQRYQEAFDSFKEVIKYSPNSYKAWYGRGWSLHQLQRYEEAVEAYNKATEIKRSDYQAWYNRGNSLYNLKKFEEALVSYNKALRYKPEHFESWYSRGNALLNLKKYKEAIASYDKALKFKPDYRQAIDGKNQAQNLSNAQDLPNNQLNIKP